jgi:hypothetical protein
MIGLLRADLLKLRKRWLYPMMVLILGFFLALAAVFLLVIPAIDPDAIPGMPVFGRSDALLLGAQQAVGQTWFALILAVVFLGGEVTSPIWATELTVEARRHLHMISKLVLLSVAAWVGVLLAIGGWSLVAVFTTEGAGLSGSQWFAIVWKSAVTQVTWTALGLGAVAMIRNTGVSIGVALAFSFFEGIGALWEPYRSMELPHALGVIAGWTVLGAVIGLIGLIVKDP